MKRFRVLAILLGVLGMSFPLLSFAAPPKGECQLGYCSDDIDCGQGGSCEIQPGQTCGVCVQ